jgi:SecD/SecF fusion protein
MSKKGYGKNQKGKGVLKLVIVLAIAVICGFGAVCGFDRYGSGSASDIKLGLDLAGGVSITYETVEENPSAEDMSDTIYKLQKRVEGYSTEAEVYKEGANRINVDIPGVSDANAILAELGTPGTLQFKDPDGNVIMTGDMITGAQAGYRKNSTTGAMEYIVELTMNDEGAKLFAEATEKFLGKVITIIYDGETVSAPTVNSVITGGRCTIENISSMEAASTLATTIRIGSLPLELTEARSTVVGAKLGEEAIATSLKAGAIGLGLVIVLMCAVYLIPGIASSVALLIYVALMVLAISGFDLTLTLPGIAGIILGIGMAVDANVIIFARIREEIAGGKSVKLAIHDGFSKALSAILDGNITTLIAAVILLWKGSGTIKGFAQTLALGIVISMFTALVVTKFTLNALYEAGFTDKKFYGTAKTRGAVDFIGKKKWFFAISGVVLAVGIGAMVINGTGSRKSALNYSLEFQGGTSTNVAFNEDKTLDEISSEVVPVVKEAVGNTQVEAQKVAGTNEVIIKTRALTVEEREALNASLEEAFSVDPEKITAQSISATVSSEMKRDAVISVVLATICMLIYIWFRFKDIRFGASAVLALVHDVLVVVTFYAVFRWSVGNTFIACVLTIVGYSINATIVIFDRIREHLKENRPKEDLKALVNTSVTETLSRSVYTSLTTLIMVVVLYIFGVTTIREFALPLMVGIVCGTFSSVCLTGSMWYMFRTKFVKKSEE